MALQDSDIFLVTKADGSESRHIRADKLLSGIADDWLVFINEGGVSKRCLVSDLVTKAADDRYMLVNQGVKSYKIKSSTVVDQYYIPISVTWSDYAWCYNKNTDQKMEPRPENTANRHKTYTNTFDGGTRNGWYLYRPKGANNVQWRYEPPASLNLYARTLRLFCGTQGPNGKSRIWVNGRERTTKDHIGHDQEGAWTVRFTINEVITSIEIRQKSGTGYDSFGVYAVEVNGVILVDGAPAPATISDAEVATLMAQNVDIPDTADIPEGDNNAEVVETIEDSSY